MWAFFDKDFLLPGDAWEKSIIPEIESSDYVIFFLSENSVKKHGFFQKEIKAAIKEQELRPSNERYLLLIVLDDCRIPTDFEGIQYIKISDDNFLDKLIKAIEKPIRY